MFVNDFSKMKGVNKIQDGTIVFSVIDYIDYSPSLTQLGATESKTVIIFDYSNGTKDKTFKTNDNTKVMRQIKGTSMLLVGDVGKIYSLDYLRVDGSTFEELDNQAQFNVFDI